jgi:hypothetical protein
MIADTAHETPRENPHSHPKAPNPHGTTLAATPAVRASTKLVTERMTSPTEHSERILEASHKVREIFLALSKLISAKTIYTPQNPTLTGFSEAFRKAVASFFEDDRELQIRVEQYRLVWRDQVVYENTDRSGSVAFVLYKDGVGEITIHSSVTSVELDQFVDIIKEEIHNPRPDADIVTKLWQTDFGSISYRVLDEDPTGEAGGDRGDGVRSRAAVLQADDHQGQIGTSGAPVLFDNQYSVSIADYLLGVVTASHPQASEHEKEQFIQDMLNTLFTVSADETRRFGEEYAEDQRRDKIALLLKTALELTGSLEDPSMLENAMRLAERASGYAKEEANARTLTRLVALIRDRAAELSTDDDLSAWLTSLDNELTDVDFLLSLGKRTDRPTEELLGVLRYCREVGPTAVPVICSLLEDFKKHVVHREACDALLALAGDGIGFIVDNLNVDDPMVARDIVYLLRKSKPERIPPLVKELVFYPDVTVREATLELLLEVGDNDSVPLITTLLDDQERGIRMRALAALEETAALAATGKVMSLCFDEDAPERDIEERSLLFATAGKLAGEAVVVKLEPMLRKRSWLGFGRNAGSEVKLLATHALEHAGGDRAEALLRDLAGDQDVEVSSRAEEALATLGVTAAHVEGHE